ncbi:MAG: DsbE family thiol:disulfide interchange protein [Pseudomonadota bacterium]
MNWIALAPIGLFAALGGFFLAANMRDVDTRDTLPSQLEGRSAPAMTLTELPGKPPFTDDLLTDGQVKIVNFWASWCVPCRAEHPHLAELSKTVPVYGINYKDEPQAALAFLEELGDFYAAIGVDGDARTGIDWGLYGVPETFVLAGDGTVMLRFAGPVTGSVIDEAIAPALVAARAR